MGRVLKIIDIFIVTTFLIFTTIIILFIFGTYLDSVGVSVPEAFKMYGPLCMYMILRYLHRRLKRIW